MILHHIAQCTAVVIISAAGLDAHVLECRNLNARDVLCVPSVGKNWVGEADGLHVAHHFLAQIMVDAIDIFRTESRFQARIERSCIVQTFTERLFQNHLTALRMSNLKQALGNGREKARRNRKVKDTGFNALFI